jgi:catechol 2,3-dioxygenase-like lactoylglutathione lyase family enzyme
LIETQGLTHIQLSVRDLQRSVAFYRSVFGMKADTGRGDENLVFLRTPGASDTVTLRQAKPDESVGSGGGLEHIGFRLVNRADLEAALTEVTVAGGKVLERGEHAPGLHYAYVADLDGYVIEF